MSALWNYETGAKWILPDGTGVIEISFFYIDWSGMQAEQVAPDTLIDFRTNAVSATSVGGEVEIRLFPCPGWELGGSLGCANAEYDEFIYEFSGEDLSGNRVAGGAKFNWSAFLSYTDENMFGPVGISANASTNGAQDRFFDAQNETPGDDHAIFNARLDLTYNAWEAFLLQTDMNGICSFSHHFQILSRFDAVLASKRG